MVYDYESRRKLMKTYKDQKLTMTETLDERKRKLLKYLFQYNSYNEVKTNPLDEELSKMKNHNMDDNQMEKPSVYMKQNFSDMIELAVDDTMLENYYHVMDSLNQYQYSKGMGRRTVRTKSFEPIRSSIFHLLKDYMHFGFYQCRLDQYLLDQLSEEQRDYKRNSYDNHFSLDLMIASAIDMGDEKVIQSIHEILFGDNNTAVVTVEVIRGIVMSKNAELHKELGQFLLAARLQEGVRQAVCENMDCGTIEAFITLFDVIKDNDLIRFAAVKRAVATWIGICNEESMDRISNKLVELMSRSLKDHSQAIELTKSNDSIEIMVGLWSLGFYEVRDAIEVMSEYLIHGTRNQLLTMSYYNRSVQYEDFAEITARKIMIKYPLDMELAAAFFHTYMMGASNLLYKAANPNNRKKDKIQPVPVTTMFSGEEEARIHYEILKELYQYLPKKGVEYSPCIFPWYSVSLTKGEVIQRMCLIAYMLQDEDILDETVRLIPEVTSTGYYTSRHTIIRTLLHAPKTVSQREMAVRLLGDKESYARDAAFEIVDRMELDCEHFQILEEMLRFKAADIRTNLYKLIQKQDRNGLAASVSRLVASKKEEVRLGGLELILMSKEKDEFSDMSEKWKDMVSVMQEPSSKEEILLAKIRGDHSEESVLEEEGYGLYKKDAVTQFEKKAYNMDSVYKLFNCNPKEMNRILVKLNDLFEQNKEKEYQDAYGEEQLLGNCFRMISYDSEKDLKDKYPFWELWKEFFEQQIKDKRYLLCLDFGLERMNYDYEYVDDKTGYQKSMDRIFGTGISQISSKGLHYAGRYSYDNRLKDVIEILADEYPMTVEREMAKDVMLFILDQFDDHMIWFKYKKSKDSYYYDEKSRVSILEDNRVQNLVNKIRNWSNDEEFREVFHIFYQLDQRSYQYQNEIQQEKDSYRSIKRYLSIMEYIKAYQLNIIQKDEVYFAIFELVGLKESLSGMSRIFLGHRTTKTEFERYGMIKNQNGEYDRDNEFFQLISGFYFQVVDLILNVELKRGEMDTRFSKCISSIGYLQGMDRLAEILLALGKDKLERNSYYGSYSTGRSSCLSHLLQVCYPKEEDSAAGLKELIKGKGITDRRLIETVMYAPQWMDIIEELTGYKGLKSGCYYFMAHMNESFDDRKLAVIAKYTPLTVDELNDGAFDTNWFKEAYDTLGESVFGLLYDSAKYISDGIKHARARKYADAALGKVTCKELEEKISDKRNKDLLMSYGIIPIKDKKDMLTRYEFVQKFLKESKKFGAQRRASESKAADVCLKNLATKAGYNDVMRLTLSMESELIQKYGVFLEDFEVKGIFIKIHIDENGKSEIQCIKNKKLLKSVPSSIAKEEYVVMLKDVHKKLKEQYSRAVKMFETAMEDMEVYEFSELMDLRSNPVIRAILDKLVFITQMDSKAKNHPAPIIGYLSDNGITDQNKNVHPIKKDARIRVAHPNDLYQNQCWAEFQKLYYTENSFCYMIKQPFKQVFRELYVKLDEELEKKASLMFAGNQIQPKKTLACLKSRRWIADYDEGLQKVFYKDNIVARIYAMADWFSPADIEAPTLEWVEFSDRKTYKTLAIKDIPEIIYSEVMRDVDLAVSVAHVGGVDPETSHSTVEMRKVIIGFNMELFGLTNVRMEKNHAFIEGSLASYNIHIGSGVIHKVGGGQINVLPVHSQSRGKLFLPFLDEDPKTAEIISKIILFARDTKIKDPYILRQI